MDKRIFLKLKSGRTYTGRIREIHDTGNGVVFITIVDKFDKLVCFTSGEIEVIQEEGI